MQDKVDSDKSSGKSESLENSEDFKAGDSSNAVGDKVTEAKDNIEAKADSSKLGKTFPLLNRLFGATIATGIAAAIAAVFAITSAVPLSLPLCISIATALFVGWLITAFVPMSD